MDWDGEIFPICFGVVEVDGEIEIRMEDWGLLIAP
jgi:hypothetical protein